MTAVVERFFHGKPNYLGQITCTLHKKGLRGSKVHPKIVENSILLLTISVLYTLATSFSCIRWGCTFSFLNNGFWVSFGGPQKQPRQEGLMVHVYHGSCVIRSERQPFSRTSCIALPLFGVTSSPAVGWSSVWLLFCCRHVFPDLADTFSQWPCLCTPVVAAPTINSVECPSTSTLLAFSFAFGC